MPTDALAGLLGTQQTDSSGFDDDMCSSMKLSKTDRLKAFGFCFVLGYFITFMSTLLLFSRAPHKIEKFSILYSLGNIVSLASSMFLSGPVKQIKSMFKPTRRWATLVYLAMLALVIVAACLHWPAIVVLVCLVVQMCAAVWYSASYVPFGRKMLKEFVTRCCGCQGCGDDEF